MKIDNNCEKSIENHEESKKIMKNQQNTEKIDKNTWKINKKLEKPTK